MNASVGMDLVRSIFAVIDRGIYFLITVLYDMIQKLSRISIFSPDNINDFSKRVYTLIGIIMLFKVTFSLITYLVNPDSMNDKTKGTGNLAKNIIITLVLIVIVPFGFDLLYNAQSAILEDKLIEKLILGTSEDYSISGSGQHIIIDSKHCIETNSSGEEIVFASDKSISDGNYIALMTFRPFFQIYDYIEYLDYNDKSAYCGVTSVSELLDADIYNKETGIANLGKYVVDYSFFLSTICGVLVALLLLEFCFDVAMRCIKLGFLEIFAPVAIISYIDPKSSQNGTFKKWLKEVVGTWARLFIRLAILSFVVYFIKMVNEKSSEYDMWIMLFLIIGALLFAKKAVPLIEDLLGIKMDHSIQLNPFKKISDQAIGGKAITGLGAGTVGAVGGTIAGVYAGKQVGAVGRGALIGAFSGFSNGKSDPKHALTSGMNKTYKSMTGNEMSTLTPSKVILGMGNKGKDSVKEMKDHLGTARGRLNEAHTRLNEISHYNATNSANLRDLKAKGFDVDMNNLDESKTKAQANINTLTVEAKNKQQLYEQRKSAYETALNEYNECKQFVDSYQPLAYHIDGTPVTNQEYEKKKSMIQQFENGGLEKLKSKVNIAENEYQKVQNDLESNRTIVNSIDSYRSLRDEETKLRGQISKIDKEISTLSDEKKQREQFWQVDTSPKTSLDDAMKNNPKEEKTIQYQQNNNSRYEININNSRINVKK